MKALYAGSFDPFTFGHLDIVKRACGIFDEVTVGVANNPNKKCMFDVDERIELIKQTLANHGVGAYVSEIRNLTADFARINGYTHLIKGVRTSQDFDYEKLINEVSLTQQRKLETVLLFSDTNLGHVSSTAAKELAKFQGLIHTYVPMNVKAAVEKKLGQLIIGVTGTIGSGKSTLCRTFEILNPDYYHHVNLDEISAQIWSDDTELCMETRSQIYQTFKTTNKKKVGEMVFSDERLRWQLNEIMREPILTLLREKLFGLRGVILLEGALLAETDWLFLCNNQVILIETPDAKIHVERLKNRGLTDEQISRRISSQFTEDEKFYAIQNKIVKDGFGVRIHYQTNTDGNVGILGSDMYKQVTELSRGLILPKKAVSHELH